MIASNVSLSVFSAPYVTELVTAPPTPRKYLVSLSTTYFTLHCTNITHQPTSPTPVSLTIYVAFLDIIFMRYNLDVSMLSDLRASRQSLMEDGRRSRASALQRSMMRKSTRASTRSRSRDKLYRDNRSRDGDRGSSGYRSRDGDSLPDSDNWAGTSTDNNWTDYDQDVYTVRSPQKTNRYSRDDVNL